MTKSPVLRTFPSAEAQGNVRKAGDFLYGA
ncbi:hypothetical protein QFZ52_001566 [Arthrobacter woluwensis]|nr:hypothetical protein [Arthrobacter woluwensis]